jgi:transposase-like protein
VNAVILKLGPRMGVSTGRLSAHSAGRRAQAVESLKATGRSTARAARDLAMTDNTLANWVWRASADAMLSRPRTGRRS